MKRKKNGFAAWSRTKKVFAAIALYLIIGLIWSIIMLIGASGDNNQVNPGFGSQLLSVVLTSVLWLPLMLISLLTK